MNSTLASSLLAVLLLALAGCACPSHSAGTACLAHESIVSPRGIVLENADRLTTLGSFKPPVNITIVAKTESTNLRMSYAADQVIFNWEVSPGELRVDGGPADGRHRAGAGSIPQGKFVTIRWSLTPRHQSIYVDNELRFEHEGDYSGLNKPVAVFPGVGSIVTVKSIKVEQLTNLPQ